MRFWAERNKQYPILIDYYGHY